MESALDESKMSAEQIIVNDIRRAFGLEPVYEAWGGELFPTTAFKNDQEWVRRILGVKKENPFYKRYDEWDR